MGGGLSTDTDTEEDLEEKEEKSKEETAVTAAPSFSQAAEQEFEPKKVCTSLPVILLTVYWAARLSRLGERTHSVCFFLPFGKFPCRVEILEIVSEYYKTDTPLQQTKHIMTTFIIKPPM